MAAKIPIGCLQANPAQTVSASEYDKAKHGGVLCPDRRCGCVLEGIPAYTRNVGDNQVNVSAFFRLPKNAEKNGLGHKPSCRFNVEKTITRLVAKSKEIKNLDSEAEPILATARGQGAEFRLHILMESLELTSNGWTNNWDTAASAKSGIGTRYVRSERLLSPYLRMAKAVLSLVARVQERPDLAASIRLKYDRYTIEWDKYFFGLAEHCKLYKYLWQLSVKSGEKLPPVAVAIKVPDCPKRTKYGDWQFRARADVCEDLAIRPVLYVKNQDLAHKIATECHVLVCALPRLGKLWKPDGERRKPEVDISLKIFSRRQVCRFSPI